MAFSDTMYSCIVKTLADIPSTAGSILAKTGWGVLQDSLNLRRDALVGFNEVEQSTWSAVEAVGFKFGDI